MKSRLSRGQPGSRSHIPQTAAAKASDWGQHHSTPPSRPPQHTDDSRRSGKHARAEEDPKQLRQKQDSKVMEQRRTVAVATRSEVKTLPRSTRLSLPQTAAAKASDWGQHHSTPPSRPPQHTDDSRRSGKHARAEKDPKQLRQKQDSKVMEQRRTVVATRSEVKTLPRSTRLSLPQTAAAKASDGGQHHSTPPSRPPQHTDDSRRSGKHARAEEDPKQLRQKQDSEA